MGWSGVWRIDSGTERLGPQARSGKPESVSERRRERVGVGLFRSYRRERTR